ncbi:amino acid adenylation domain-containing protein [Kribbella antibiotica]|uniref:Amino acid adenylation domain-containing protein n=1 Tax=Kribbella antibiotica TaxID=190195 RepID=A0A4R4ZA44_9ACTN|nr:non-ribosomal peptide synthetase [Kribbella antibiotica]TDD54174.1 amino acid adenylation domain-containing protein [Kribbella antibiotica]
MTESLSQQLGNLSAEQQASLRERLQQLKDAPVPFHQLFRDQAAQYPDRVAVTFGDTHLTYAALDQWSNRLAHHLRDRGVGRESLVGLCVSRSLEMVISLLAILKAGGAYVPLDPAYPRDRLAYMVTDAAIPVVLAQHSALEALPKTDATVVIVEDLRTELVPHADPLPDQQSSVDDLAYVMYTSGSTGRPKGVSVTHRGFRALARWQHQNYGLDTPQRVLQGTSLNFDISVWELAMALLSGGTVVLPPPDLPMLGAALADLLQEQGVENVSLTPSALATLPEDSLSAVRCLTVGGEPCPLDLVRIWAPGRIFVNGYGPTETTIGVCLARYTADLDRVHIGRPLNGTQLYILDSSHQPLPEGAAGELYVGGSGVARGYLGRPDLTADAFVANPFAADGSRLYRTGDLARRRADGNIELLGRVDDQVKIRGFRVELGEIEATLEQHPDVRHAAVLLHENTRTKQLVAYLKQRGDATAEDLRSFLSDRLPEYMIPGVFVVLKDLPVTTNGKVDRQALAAVSWEGQAAGPEYVAPRTPVEAQLAEIWRTVLDLDRPVGVHDSFFALGGDSILSLQVTFRAKQLGLRFTVKQLFEHQTIARLAPSVQQQAAPSLLLHDQGTVTGPVEPTPIQRWFFDQEFTHPHHFNQSVLIDVPARLEATQWERVLVRLLEHHDALRTRFATDGTADIAGLPDAVHLQVHAGEIGDIAAETQAGFDLSEAPLFRAVLFTGPSKLLLVAHHLVVDVVSWQILLEDLATLAAQAEQGQALTLPTKTTSWQLWAARLNQAADPAELPYWNEQTAPTQPLPIDGTVEHNTVGRSRHHDVVLGPEDTQALLSELPATFNTQINDVLLTALASAVGAWTKDSHVSIGLEGHGREDLFDDLDVSRTVGWFTTVSPVRLPVPDEPATGLKLIKDLLRNRPRQGIGYGLLAQGPELPASPAQISFNHLGRIGHAVTASEATGPEENAANRRPYLIDIVSHLHEGRLHLRWTYGEDAHHESTIRQLADHALDVLRQLIAAARSADVNGYSPSDFPLTSLTQPQLDALVADVRDRRPNTSRRPLTDCYPQTPIQQGLRFQSQYAPGQGVYHVQLIVEIEQILDVELFRQAWSQVMSRHPILRTGFWETDTGQALQVVFDTIEVPLWAEDWRDGDRLDSYLDEDRATGFSSDDIPQWWMLLARTGDAGYRLVWSAHHAILDGWSISLLLDDAARHYDALVQGRSLDDLPVLPYREYVEWLAGQDLQAAELYWRETLEGLEAPTPISNRSTAGTGEPVPQARREFFLTAAETSGLRSFAQQHGLTVNAVLQGAWGLLLGSYTNSDDVVFGTVSSGRPADILGIEDMAGLFINTLPLRVRIPRRTTALEWLRQLQEQSVQLRQYDYSPLGQVRRWSDLPPNTPLFDTLFVFENYPERPDRESGLKLDAVGSLEQTHYPLTVVITGGEQLGVSIFFDPLRYDDRLVEAIFTHLRQLCRGLVVSPDKPLAQLQMLTDDERGRALDDWSTDSTSYDDVPYLHELIGDQTLATPDAIAIVQDEQQLTYRELDQRANQLAHWLQDRGIGPEVLVGLCVDRSLEGIIGLLGVLKAGGGYVPLDPRNPLERLSFVAQDAGLRLLLTQSHLLAGVPADELPTLCLDTEWSSVASDRTEAPLTTLTPDNLAYIIYTSGSTGKPKGVMVAHRCLGHVVPWIRRHGCFTEPQNVLQVASLSFDFSVWEVLLPLMTGGTLHLPPGDVRMIGNDLYDVLVERSIESLNFTPGALATLPSDASLPHLRTLVVGGEAYPADLIRTWAPGRTFFNVYGPTETTIFATGTQTDESLETIHIGRPITNVRTYVLDAALRPVPAGVPGELYIGGVGVTRGYLNRPDLTADVFVADPFGEPGGRLYKSGDLVRLLADGNIEFVGRTDNQVKIRGFRMELGEIDAVLEQHPAVRGCATLAQPDGSSRRLVAYVVADAVTPELSEVLRAHLRKHLLPYMVPSAFVYLDRLPLNSNGKVNRKVLPLPDDATEPVADDNVPPRTETEATLAAIWSDVLHHPVHGVYDDFFVLGGHSLLAVKVVARVQQAFAVDLPVRVLFEQPTIAQVAATIDSLAREQDHANVPLVPVPRDQAVPATFDQRRVWYLEQLRPDSALYTVGWLLYKHTSIDPERLRAALATLIERHESLRTTLTSSSGQLWQTIADPGSVVLAVSDLSGEPAARHREAVQALTHDLWLEPFDLAAGPLFRVLLIQLPDSESLLAFSAHHAIIDGYSMGILNDELFKLYDSPETVLAPLPIQYADYAAWQAQWLEEERLRPHLDYWTEHLADAPALISLPTDHPRPAVQSHRGATTVSSLPTAVGKRLDLLSRSHRTTSFVTVLSAFAIVLSRYSGQDKVVIGIPVANRGRVETEPLIGFLVNTVPLCVNLSGEPTFGGVVDQVRRKLLEAQSHQEVPFDRIVEELRPDRSLSHSPVFQVMFTGLDKLFDDPTDQPDWIHDVTDAGIGVSKFDLGLSITRRQGRLQFTFEYGTDLFGPATIAGLDEHLRTLLATAVDAPATPIAQLPLLTPTERTTILETRNATEDESTARPVLLHHLFEEQARTVPDRVAVSFEDQQLTYAELDRRANSLARVLADRGVGPETPVGICMNRSLDLVIGLLGILKAGGAYVPLDPEYPADRLRYIAENANLTITLTDADISTLETTDGPAPDVSAGPDNLAYVIYTSGSTGRPKGAMLSHRGICNRLLWMQNTYQLQHHDHVLQKTPFSFDVSVWEFFWPLVAGARLHLASPGGHKDPAYLAELIDAQSISVMHFVPSMLVTFLQQRSATERCRSLRDVMCSGEALPPDVQAQFEQLLPRTRLHNLYGPTEASVDVSYWECMPGATTVPIGRPVANTQLYVLDTTMSPVPDGVIGELFIGGVQLARGYLARPDLTAERFVADPFGRGRLYATGDLARFRPDGAIEYVGRTDHQVKIRGHRIEIGEIESVLAEHPDVGSCLVVMHEVTSTDKRLTAFLTPSAGQPVRDDVLRAHLLERLPEYAVPTYFVTLPELPLTPNGKVDRKALPSLSDIVQQARKSEAYAPPTTPTEGVLAGIWARLLKLDQVGIHDDFFGLGGHSLLVASMATEVQELWDISLMLPMVYQNRTVAQLAHLVDDLIAGGADDEPDATELFDLL